VAASFIGGGKQSTQRKPQTVIPWFVYDFTMGISNILMNFTLNKPHCHKLFLKNVYETNPSLRSSADI
jgi:hypothetical protein